jgi:hypothetical protein
VEVPNGDARDLHRKCEKMTDLIVPCWDEDGTKFGRCVPGEMMFVLDECVLPRYARGDCICLLAMPMEMVLVPIVGTTTG